MKVKSKFVSNSSEILHLCEDIRKKRTSTFIKGAVDIVHLFQIPHSVEIEQNQDLSNADLHVPNSTIRWKWANLRYQEHLLRFETIAAAHQEFADWSTPHHWQQDRARM